MGDILSIKLLEQFIFEDIDSDNARETARAKKSETLLCKWLQKREKFTSF